MARIFVSSGNTIILKTVFKIFNHFFFSMLQVRRRNDKMRQRMRFEIHYVFLCRRSNNRFFVRSRNDCTSYDKRYSLQRRGKCQYCYCTARCKLKLHTSLIYFNIFLSNIRIFPLFSLKRHTRNLRLLFNIFNKTCRLPSNVFLFI